MPKVPSAPGSLCASRVASTAASRPGCGGSAERLEGTLRARMHRVATPRGQASGAGALTALSAASGLRLEAFRAEHVADRIDRALAAEGPAHGVDTRRGAPAHARGPA